MLHDEGNKQETFVTPWKLYVNKISKKSVLLIDLFILSKLFCKHYGQLNV